MLVRTRTALAAAGLLVAAGPAVAQLPVAPPPRPVEQRVRAAAPTTHDLSVLMVQVSRTFLVDCGIRTVAEQQSAWTPSDLYTLTEREHRMLTAALRTASDRQVLSRPQLRVLDNQRGLVQVGLPTGEGAAMTVGLTPRQSADGKTTEMRADIQVRGPKFTVPVKDDERAFAFNVQSLQTTWLHPAGSVGVIAVKTTDAADRHIEVLIIVTPTRPAGR